jgi:hypothetical protein
MQDDKTKPEQQDQASGAARPDGTAADKDKAKDGPALVSTAISSGKPIDDAGGAGLGQPPGQGDTGSPTSVQSQEKPASDPQDRRDPQH